jgi:hypothetical protein
MGMGPPREPYPTIERMSTECGTARAVSGVQGATTVTCAGQGKWFCANKSVSYFGNLE